MPGKMICVELPMGAGGPFAFMYKVHQSEDPILYGPTDGVFITRNMDIEVEFPDGSVLAIPGFATGSSTLGWQPMRITKLVKTTAAPPNDFIFACYYEKPELKK